jgi:hypothetical protein
MAIECETVQVRTTNPDGSVVFESYSGQSHSGPPVWFLERGRHDSESIGTYGGYEVLVPLDSGDIPAAGGTRARLTRTLHSGTWEVVHRGSKEDCKKYAKWHNGPGEECILVEIR